MSEFTTSENANELILALPSGIDFKVYQGIKVSEVLEKLKINNIDKIIALKIGDEILDLQSKVLVGGEVEFITLDSELANEVIRHSLAHIMAEAVMEIFPNAQLGIGPAIENGFYYDFMLPRTLTPEDLKTIEEKMKQSIKSKHKFIREEMSKEAAIKLFTELNQPFKVELLNEISDSKISIYKHGKFLDLCKGPHMPHTGVVGHFKLLSVAGAYWRGDSNRPMLQRIYGAAFIKKEDLDNYLKNLEEAKKRDHRKLGKELDLFSIHEDVGAGLIFWHPKGAIVRHIVETYWKEQHFKHGYELIYTPHIGRSWLWETSGHLSFYKESMYNPINIDQHEYYIKPMNCPFHIMIYKTAVRSYKELPLRWAELGTVYRYEKSGVLHGLLRVRGFTQDDAHIICTPEQVDDEIREVIRFSIFMLRSFGFENFKAYLATKPEKYVGDEDSWNLAINALKKAVEKENISYELDEGGGAFYGPKIDIKIKDALGREWQMSTIQFDFNLPNRFDMSFIAQNGQQKRPYMIHRALLGSIERFFGILLEHYAGAFPVWLAPIQVAILPISDKHIEYCKNIENELHKFKIRTYLDSRDEKISYKVRSAQLQKIPYMLIIGDNELSTSTITLRKRTGENILNLSLNTFIEQEKWHSPF